MAIYYKITNEAEKHYGLQYHDGLVEDIVPFNPHGSCEPGGIYFTDVVNILGFINYGPWLRKVTIPEDAQVYEDPSYSPRKWKADKVFLHPRERITAEVVKRLIDEGANVHANKNKALRWASETGNLEIMEILLKAGADVHFKDDIALRRASGEGHLEIVKLLLEAGADIHAINDEAFRGAILQGFIEIAELLIKAGANIHAMNNEALRWSSVFGRIEALKFLLKAGADIHFSDDGPLRWAVENGQTEAVKFLLEAGANVHAKNNHALRLALLNNYIETAKVLLEAGARPSAPSMQIAIDNGWAKGIELLLDKGAELPQDLDFTMETLARRGHTKVIEVLAERGNVDKDKYLQMAESFREVEEDD